MTQTDTGDGLAAHADELVHARRIRSTPNNGEACNLDGKQAFPANVADRVDESSDAFGVKRL